MGNQWLINCGQAVGRRPQLAGFGPSSFAMVEYARRFFTILQHGESSIYFPDQRDGYRGRAAVDRNANFHILIIERLQFLDQLRNCLSPTWPVCIRHHYPVFACFARLLLAGLCRLYPTAEGGWRPLNGRSTHGLELANIVLGRERSSCDLDSPSQLAHQDWPIACQGVNKVTGSDVSHRVVGESESSCCLEGRRQ